MATSIAQSPAVSESAPGGAPRFLEALFLRSSGAPASWNWKTLVGLAALVVIWGAWFYGTWETWGWLTSDSGREIYVPAALSQGKTLYKDIWYLYGPLAPYFNSFLFRIFGIHLSVLYWAGSLSALGSAVLLYLTGMRMSSALAGWTTAAVVLTQSFHRSLFSFPLPYSFASVYGCLAACFLLWLLIGGLGSDSRLWVLGAGIVAAAAVLLKLEIGISCYGGLMLLIAARAIRQRSWKSAMRDLTACLPGLAICIIVLIWLISLGGVEFLTQENISSWPTSYFMKTYGKYWLAWTGLELTRQAFLIAAKRTLLLLGIFQGFHLILSWKSTVVRQIILRITLFTIALVFFAVSVIGFGPLQMFQETLRNLFFPRDVALYVALAATAGWLHFAWRHRERPPTAPLLCFSFAVLFGFRILLMNMPCGYPIFYNGPVVLSMLLLVRQLIPSTGRSRRFLLVAEGTLCAMVLLAATVNWNRLVESPFPRTARLTTKRGNIFLSPQMAEQYQAAINFINDQRLHGEEVLSLPEDTALYFLAATDSPTRVFAFDPGVVAPGKMTEDVIRQIERKPVRYLIWSNRTFPEYNAPRFGIDFNQELGQYLFSHYHPVRPLAQHAVYIDDWNAFIWERNPEIKPQ